MLRFCPKKIKQKFKIGKFEILDLVFIFLTAVIVLILLFAGGIPTNLAGWIPRGIISFVILIVGVILNIPLEADSPRLRSYVGGFIKFIFRRKKYEAVALEKDMGIEFQDYILYNPNKKLYSLAIEVKANLFLLKDVEEQDELINELSRTLKMVKKGTLLKLDIPINVADYYVQNKNKVDYFTNIIETSDNELAINNAQSEIAMLKEEEQTLKLYLTHEYQNQRYFVLLYNQTKDELINDSYNVLNLLKDAHFEGEIIGEETFRKVIKYYYDAAKNSEKDIVLNPWKENATSILINVGKDVNGKTIYKKYRNYAITSMPRQTINGWLSNLANMQGVKVSFKLNNNIQTIKSKNELSSGIMELKMQLNRPQKIYEREEIEWQIEACKNLISDLNSGREILRDVYVQFLVPDEINKDFLNQASMDGIKINKLFFRQAEAYLNCDLYKFCNTKPLKSATMTLPSSIVGANYMFSYPIFFDEQGELIGDSFGYPVFFDPFYNLNSKSNLRVNANISITGTSGVGKSYLSKILLLNNSTVADKIRILDPENEYASLCKNLYGKDINVSGGEEVINPLQIFPSLTEGEYSNDVSLHKQFLDEFFKTCIRKLHDDDLLSSYLNRCIDILYARYNYFDGCVISDNPDDYPIMQDLYDVIREQYNIELGKKNEYEARFYKELLTLLGSFVSNSDGNKEFIGAKAKLWNGKTTLKLDNRVIVFNFQNLLSSNNKDISAAQMLLVMKFLNQEIILNKNTNEKKHSKNKVVIMVDEAHNFISKDYPIALTFLYRMSKQIRKYDGSLIITTQQINDFLGGDENTAKLAKGIIANCQYSFIFGNPNSINEVKNLYGEIMRFTDDELSILRNNKRGTCLFQLSPNCRTILNVEAVGNTATFFDNR